MGCGASSTAESKTLYSNRESKTRPAAARAGEQQLSPGPAAPVPAMAKLRSARDSWAQNRIRLQAWLDSTPEEALEPDLPIVDPHHHAWDMRELQGFNLFGLFKQQYYMSDELCDDFIGAGHNVTHTVYAEAHAFHSAANGEGMAPRGEVVAMQGLAAQFDSGKYGSLRALAGIIGTADLAGLGAQAEPVLVACKAACPNFRGIRVNGQYDPDIKFGVGLPNLYMQPKFREGFALLARHDLTFDAFLYSSQLPDLHDLATSFPDTTIVLDHNGCPAGAFGGDREGSARVLAQWKVDMGRIAQDCQNVYVKVGGYGMPQMGHGFDEREAPPGSEEVAALFRDCYLWTVDTFGPARCMFEGNFPVDKVSMSYTVVWNSYKRMTKDVGISAADRALLFGGTAKRVYRLE
jgi:L-fuconolactonase